jgi:hypothetical protein
MRSMFGLVGIVVTLLIVGVLVKKQLGPATPAATAASAATGAPAAVPLTAMPQQVKQTVETTLQAPRGDPAEK